jgi:hypothetical protein
MVHHLKRWRVCLMVITALVLTGVFTAPGIVKPAHTAHAQALTSVDVSAAIQYADSHWNWDYYDPNNHGTVGVGASQDRFQCAEFVARALAAEGLVPGLTPFSPPGSFGSYAASPRHGAWDRHWG